MAKHSHIDFEELNDFELPEPGKGEVSITLVTDESRSDQYFEPIGLKDEPDLQIVTLPTADRGGGPISLTNIVDAFKDYAYTCVILIGEGALMGVGEIAIKETYRYLSDRLTKALAGHETQAKYHFQRLDNGVTLIVEAPANLKPANARELVGLAFDFLREPGNTRYREAVYDSKHGELISMKEF